MDFLQLVRDELTDGINEGWTLEDILQPLKEAFEQVMLERRRSALQQLSKRPRPSRISSIRLKTIDVLCGYKNDGMTLKEALEAWADTGHQKGLTLTKTSPTEYSIQDDNAFGAEEFEKQYKDSTLKEFWKKIKE